MNHVLTVTHSATPKVMDAPCPASRRIPGEWQLSPVWDIAQWCRTAASRINSTGLAALPFAQLGALGAARFVQGARLPGGEGSAAAAGAECLCHHGGWLGVA